MAGTLVANNTAALTANGTTAGVVTVANSALFPAGSICWLNGDALDSVKVKVIKILSATTLSVRIIPEPSLNEQIPLYGQVSDISAYTTAKNSRINVEQQVIDEYAAYHLL